MKRWAAHPDPLVETAGVLGLILAANQPTYPLYVWLLAGEGAGRACVVLAALPFFAAVPWLGRRAPLAARVLLIVTGIANTLLAARVLGPEAGLDYLLLPCAALAAILLRATERIAMLALVALAVAAWLLANGPPAGLFPPDAYAALRRMNAISALALAAMIGWLSPPASPLLPPRA